MITGNKGDWSEIYTLFKILGDGVVYAGNGKMERIDNLFYPIMRVIRAEKEQDNRKNEFIHHYEPNKDGRIVSILNEAEEELMRVSMVEFESIAKSLLGGIRESKGSAFPLPKIEEFMHSVKCHTLKASSKDKADIRVVIHDLRTGITPQLGFSIKSQLGEPATLLNAGKTTNFTYKITGVNLTDADIAEINAIQNQNPRMESLFSRGAILKYHSMDCQTFEDNLIIIDSFMPEIVSECIVQYYMSKNTGIDKILQGVISRNPLGIKRIPEIYYISKIKSLLVDTALGMVPSRVWKREYDATGGYLVVRSDGEVLCYHFYDRNQFEDYLFQNTKLEFASRKRHDYGYVYREGSNVFIKLNLQIRFK